MLETRYFAAKALKGRLRALSGPEEQRKCRFRLPNSFSADSGRRQVFNDTTLVMSGNGQFRPDVFHCSLRY